ncbi:hypothetical protein [Mycoplasma sp. P36-A1]|uniref:hypothetical protein n=1 Tax=Mycoplasma sp. P36-A1 TaxID=3252900 RepID=UPI003C2E9F2B
MDYIKKQLIEEMTCVKIKQEFKNSEIYDLQLITQGYYRIMIAVDFDNGLVDIKSNIKEINNETLFEIEVEDDEGLEAILTQADFIFSNFIFLQLFNDDVEIMVACEYLDIKEYENIVIKAANEFNQYINAIEVDENHDLEYHLSKMDDIKGHQLHDTIQSTNEKIDDIFIESLLEAEPFS